MKKSENAKKLFEQGYNCAQAVFCAFCEDEGISFKTGLKLSSSFGGGMGRLREVCGAVSGMFLAAGIIYGYDSNDDKQAKTMHYKLIQKLAEKFKEENGSIICRDLLGLNRQKDSYVPEDRTKEYYKKRPCAELVAFAAEILENYIEEKKKSQIQE
ncbi:MAG: C-GCAxxG-C-C family protein [Endomicrobiaceae bacterium]